MFRSRNVILKHRLDVMHAGDTRIRKLSLVLTLSCMLLHHLLATNPTPPTIWNQPCLGQRPKGMKSHEEISHEKCATGGRVSKGEAEFIHSRRKKKRRKNSHPNTVAGNEGTSNYMHYQLLSPLLNILPINYFITTVFGTRDKKAGNLTRKSHNGPKA